MGVHRTCGEPGEIKKNTHPKNITALPREQASYDSDTSPCKRALTRTEAYKALHNQGMVRVQNATNIDLSHAWLTDAGYSAVWVEGWAQNVSIVSNVVVRAGVMGVYAS